MHVSELIERLNSAGYSSKDIIDLAMIFQNQLANFEFNADKNNFNEAVHKLKGGLRLLCLEQQLHNLEKIELNKNHEQSIYNRSEIKSFIRDLESDMQELLASL